MFQRNAALKQTKHKTEKKKKMLPLLLLDFYFSIKNVIKIVSALTSYKPQVIGSNNLALPLQIF